jgi:hypothetical protein
MSNMFEPKRKNSTLPYKLTKRPLGKILINGEFIAHQDLEQALENQIHTNELLGEILVHMGLVDQVDLKVVLSIQQDLVSLEDALKLAAGVRQLLGELLIQAKRITPEQLEHALQKQQRTGKKLGEVLVRLQVISAEELDGLLAFQQHQSDPLRAVRLRLGQLLVTTNKITQEQLQNALRKQQLSPHRKIGELLVEEGYVTHEEVSYGLKLQRQLLTAALVAILSLSSPISLCTEHSEAGSSDEQTTTGEMAAAYATLKIVYQTPELVVTQADILRGYVEVKSASRIEIRSNVFFFLRFSGLEEPFKEVQIRGFGKDVVVDSGGSSLFLPDIRGFVTFELTYKFILLKDAHPGTYVWPVEISAHPTMVA